MIVWQLRSARNLIIIIDAYSDNIENEIGAQPAQVTSNVGTTKGDKMKTAIAFAIGMAVTISAFFCMGFTSSGGSNQNGVILVSNDGGGAYFYNGEHLFYVQGTDGRRVVFSNSPAIK